MAYIQTGHRMKCPDCNKEWIIKLPQLKKSITNPYHCGDCKRFADIKSTIWEPPVGLDR